MAAIERDPENKKTAEQFVLEFLNKNIGEEFYKPVHMIAIKNLYEQNKKFGEYFQPFPKDVNLRNFEVIDIIGDGHCFLHSFLMLLSPTYRLLNVEYKKKSCEYFRLALAEEIKTNPSQFMKSDEQNCDSQDVETDENKCPKTSKLNAFLCDLQIDAPYRTTKGGKICDSSTKHISTEAIDFFSRYFSINVLLFQYNDTGCFLTLFENDVSYPYVGLLNYNGVHYEAVVEHNVENTHNFTIDKKEIDEIRPLLDKIREFYNISVNVFNDLGYKTDITKGNFTNVDITNKKVLKNILDIKFFLYSLLTSDYEKIKKYMFVDRWICKCGRYNAAISSNCGNCKDKKPLYSDLPIHLQNVMDLKKDTWNCSACTFENPNTSNVCEECRTKRIGAAVCEGGACKSGASTEPLHEKLQNVIYSKKDTWNCLACTFENPNTTNVCEVCGTKRKGAASKMWTCEECKNENADENSECVFCYKPKIYIYTSLDNHNLNSFLTTECKAISIKDFDPVKQTLNLADLLQAHNLKILNPPFCIIIETKKDDIKILVTKEQLDLKVYTEKGGIVGKALHDMIDFITQTFAFKSKKSASRKKSVSRKKSASKKKSASRKKSVSRKKKM